MPLCCYRWWWMDWIQHHAQHFYFYFICSVFFSLLFFSLSVITHLPVYEGELRCCMRVSGDHRSACQRENGTDNGDSNFKAATWRSCLCLMSQGTFKTLLISQPTLLPEWQVQKGVYAPCVSALADWAISVSSSFPAVSEMAQPTWCLLDEGLCWHLSVSGQPSVAPSISLADSSGPGASLTPSLHQLYATLPALA